MAIGVTRSGNYEYAGVTDTLKVLGQSVKFFVVDTTVDLTAEDDAADEAFEAVALAVPNILAMSSDGTNGILYLCVDGVNAPTAAALQTAIRAIGAKKGAVNLGSTTVTEGTAFTVS